MSGLLWLLLGAVGVVGVMTYIRRSTARRRREEDRALVNRASSSLDANPPRDWGLAKSTSSKPDRRPTRSDFAEQRSTPAYDDGLFGTAGFSAASHTNDSPAPVKAETAAYSGGGGTFDGGGASGNYESSGSSSTSDSSSSSSDSSSSSSSSSSTD